MDRCLIIGGGVIGLSLAWELARQGTQAEVYDRAELGRESSWAGAGILPPAASMPAAHPYEQLAAWSAELHPRWAEQLRAETGIDTGYRRSGGLYLAFSEAEAGTLHGLLESVWHPGRVEAAWLAPDDLARIEPALSPGITRRLAGAAYLPGEAQLRNPWHVRALVEACRRHAVGLHPQVPVEDIERTGDHVTAVVTSRGRTPVDRVVVAGGAWSGRLAQRLGASIFVRPVRGQMVLFHEPRPTLTRIVNVGTRYLVPRGDGRVLAGSTEEETGFEKGNTPEAVAELTDFARDLVPALREAPVEATWSGLRPASGDGLPYLGRVPGLKNAFVATGHFRAGLQLSPATAVVLAALVRGEWPQLDLSPFALDRRGPA